MKTKIKIPWWIKNLWPFGPHYTSPKETKEVIKYRDKLKKWASKTNQED